MKHKHNLSLISKRRQLIMKMMTLTKKNQNKMKQLDRRPLLTMDSLFYCRELLERVNQIEHPKHSQTDIISQKTTYSSYPTTTTIHDSTTPSFSSCLTPFQDALSMYHVEKSNNVHTIQSKRPLTAPLKNPTWINYCRS